MGQRFRESGTLDPVDFYMMLAWKANRAKNYHRERLKRLSKSSFEYAVSQIALSYMVAQRFARSLKS